MLPLPSLLLPLLSWRLLLFGNAANVLPKLGICHKHMLRAWPSHGAMWPHLRLHRQYAAISIAVIVPFDVVADIAAIVQVAVIVPLLVLLSIMLLL